MGKYTRKGKITGDVVAVMEVSSSLGVRTRAKTLALQRQRASPDSCDYLQLRSRRLEKPPLLAFATADAKKPPRHHGDTRSSFLREVISSSGCRPKEVALGAEEGGAEGDLGAEASFAENNSGFEARESKGRRERTPCSLIRDPETIRTPGSSTRRAFSTQSSRRVQDVMLGNFPTPNEMEEFFAYAEQQQQRLFVDKYNFDVVNDLPLPGRYDWVAVNP